MSFDCPAGLPVASGSRGWPLSAGSRACPLSASDWSTIHSRGRTTGSPIAEGHYSFGGRELFDVATGRWTPPKQWTGSTDCRTSSVYHRRPARDASGANRRYRPRGRTTRRGSGEADVDADIMCIHQLELPGVASATVTVSEQVDGPGHRPQQ